MSEAYIYDTVRTPRGKGKGDGALNEVPPVQLAAHVLRALRDRNDLDTSLVEDVVLGCVDPVGDQGGDVARSAVLVAGYDESVAGVQLNRFCASGLEALNTAASRVMAGQADFSIGGGVECMSFVPMGGSGAPQATDPDMAISQYFLGQGIAADLIATREGYTRDDVDAYAMESQTRAATAWKEGRFKKSVVPVTDENGLTILAKDEHVRPGTDMQSLGSLRPAFEKLAAMGGFDSVAKQRYPDVERLNHVHTAGNSSGIVDGATAILVGSKEGGKKAGLKPRARIKGFSVIGTEPSIMLTGPEFATKRVLKKLGMTVDDIDLFEVNEAFASVVMRFASACDVPMDKINVNGGAIAMGHPLGATGAMIIGTLIDELERQDKSTGLATLCVAGGMGIATVIERV